MIVIDSDLDPGDYFLRLYARAPVGVAYDGAIILNNAHGAADTEQSISILGSGQWNMHEFPLSTNIASRIICQFQDHDGLEIAYPLIINRKGKWRVVKVQSKH